MPNDDLRAVLTPFQKCGEQDCGGWACRYHGMAEDEKRLVDALATALERLEAAERGLVAGRHVYVELANGRRPQDVDRDAFLEAANAALAREHPEEGK